jgi:hypothetical protein
MASALLVLSLLLPQDAFEKWIVQLGHESIVDREEAARRLQALGSAAIGRLEKAREASGDSEVRARIDAIILQVRKDADLAKALGPTRRVTIGARKEPLKEILRQLHAPGVSEVLAGALDEEARLDFQVRGVTWWEALDLAARAANARYRIDANRDGAVKVTLLKGVEPAAPVFYAEQFRISVVESKRIEYRTPAGSQLAGLLVVEWRHQPDLKPVRRAFRNPLKFTSVIDAKGDDVRLDRFPPWATRQGSRARPLAFQESVWVRSDAVLPITLAGTTDALFPSETREIELDLAGDGSETRLGKIHLSVESIVPTKDETKVSIRGEAEEPCDLGDRMTGEVHLVDAKGARHPGGRQSGMSSGNGRSARWDFVFTSGIEGPRRIAFRWSGELYRVEIPFRLEGVRLPDFSR